MAEDVRETLFDLPSDPDQIGVIIPPSNLRRLDFSGLDYDTARRAIIEYIKTYFPDDFNDFIASNGVIMILEIVSAVTAKLSLRSDILSNEAFLPTSTTEEAVVNHLALINQRIKRQTPAVVDVECTVDVPVPTEIEIEAGTKFSVSSSDGSQIFYEIYSAPNDWVSSIKIRPNKRGVIAWGVEGQFGSTASFTSAGGPNQVYTLVDDDILEHPIFVNVMYGSSKEEWTPVFEPIENYGPNDKVVEVSFIGGNVKFSFGDDITGKTPLSGSEILIDYRVGGGKNGRIGVGLINTSRQISSNNSRNAAVSVNFRNITPSNGGVDKETVARAKKRAPRDLALQRSIVTATDYAQSVENFSHPSFGSVSKAVSTIRTGLNANLIELYVLAQGPNDIPTAPNQGLKAGIKTYIEQLNVLTDHVEVYDGILKPIDIEINVIIDRNTDASIIKTKVEDVVSKYFNIDDWDMGEGFYVSNLIEAIESIDGISYIDVFKPTDNILPTGEIYNGAAAGVAANELIILGNRIINYYYNKI